MVIVRNPVHTSRRQSRPAHGSRTPRAATMGAATVLASLAKPGDLVLTEHVTYTGMKAIASLLHLQLRGLPLDGHGLIPEAFEAACREQAPRALYCMPTLHNPTARTMPLGRRQAVAEIAARYD